MRIGSRPVAGPGAGAGAAAGGDDVEAAICGAAPLVTGALPPWGAGLIVITTRRSTRRRTSTCRTGGAGADAAIAPSAGSCPVRTRTARNASVARKAASVAAMTGSGPPAPWRGQSSPPLSVSCSPPLSSPLPREELDASPDPPPLDRVLTGRGELPDDDDPELLPPELLAPDPPRLERVLTDVGVGLEVGAAAATAVAPEDEADEDPDDPADDDDGGGGADAAGDEWWRGWRRCSRRTMRIVRRTTSVRTSTGALEAAGVLLDSDSLVVAPSANALSAPRPARRASATSVLAERVMRPPRYGHRRGPRARPVRGDRGRWRGFERSRPRGGRRPGDGISYAASAFSRSRGSKRPRCGRRAPRRSWPAAVTARRCPRRTRPGQAGQGGDGAGDSKPAADGLHGVASFGTAH